MEIIKRKKRVIIKSKLRLIIFLTVFMLIISAAVAIMYNRSYAESDIRKYIVEEGDSIWSIAIKYKDAGCDIRDYVYKIKKLNSLSDTTIKPGDTILLPA